MKKIMLMLGLLGLFGCQNSLVETEGEKESCGSCEMALFGEIDMTESCEDSTLKLLYLKASICQINSPYYTVCEDSLCNGLPISKDCINNIKPTQVPCDGCPSNGMESVRQTVYYNLQVCLADTVMPNEE